jgi:hypothetical protein
MGSAARQHRQHFGYARDLARDDVDDYDDDNRDGDHDRSNIAKLQIVIALLSGMSEESEMTAKRSTRRVRCVA